MRTAGLLLMAMVPLLVGCSSALRYRRGQRQVDEFIGLIEELRAKIRYYKLPLGEIFAELKLPHLTQFSHDLREMSFGEALLNNRGAIVIGDNCFERLLAFASELGKSGCDEQVRNCDALLEALIKERDRLSTEVPKQMKISLSLGSMAGAMMLLLFL